MSEFNDDTLALDYIRKRGYASYSSIKMVRDCEIPSTYSSEAQNFGKELHSRLLENKKLQKFSPVDEKKLADMLKVLRTNSVVTQLLDGASTEEEFKQPYMGVTVLGYLDIKNLPNIADLKTTRHKTLAAFAADMDFLQAALYLGVTGATDFFYLGIYKEKPYNVMPFSVHQYPARLKAAQADLKRLLKYIKNKL